MNWFLYALAGYFLYAFVTLANKFLLRQRATTKPIVFTFWVGLFSCLTFVLAPFGLQWPGFGPFLFDIFIGLVFFFSILYFYESLDLNDASTVAPLIGALIPLAVLPLSYLLLSESLSYAQLAGFFLLVLGGFLISVKKRRNGFAENLKGVKFIALTIALHAFYWVLVKYAFDQQGFITGFVWSRLGFSLAALLLLLRPVWRKMILASEKQIRVPLGLKMISARLAAGFGSLFVHFAISRSSAALVNAFQGTEYVFLLGFAIFLSRKFPDTVREEMNIRMIIQKIIAVLLIGAGLGILAL